MIYDSGAISTRVSSSCSLPVIFSAVSRLPVAQNGLARLNPIDPVARLGKSGTPALRHIDVDQEVLLFATCVGQGASRLGFSIDRGATTS